MLELTLEKRQNLIEKLGEALKEFEIDSEIITVRQCVCPLKESEFENIFNIVVEKNFDHSSLKVYLNSKIKWKTLF